MNALSSGPPRGLRFALLASPVVQALRFGTKIGLTWFLAPEVFGPAALAGLVAYLAAHVALLGLNEALVQGSRPGAELWRRLRALHQRSGAAVAALMAAGGGLFMLAAPGDPRGTFLCALAPMVWLANLATLPTALLVREQRYAALFRVDVASTLALSTTTLGLAAASAGAWAVVGGLYANALVASWMARAEARSLLPPDAGDETYAQLTAKGRHFCWAELLSVSGELSDSLAVGFLLGPLAMGLYTQALALAQVLMNYTTSLAERSLFPFLADRRRRDDALGPAYAQSLRVCLLFVLPAHALLALAAEPLVSVLLDPEWAGVADLLVLLALACGARCLDIVATTALKAQGDAVAVRRLGVWRLALLLPLLLGTLPFGVLALAAGVLLARLLAAGVSLRAASELLPRGPAGELASGCRALAAWGVAFPLAGTLVYADLADGWRLPLLVTEALLLWVAARWVLDRSAFAREIQAIARRIASTRPSSR